MKKWILLSLAVVVVLLCIWRSNHRQYPSPQPPENIKTIEIVDIKDYRIISNCYYEGIITMATIDPMQHQMFLKEFDKIRCKKYTFHPQDIIEGTAIRLTY